MFKYLPFVETCTSDQTLYKIMKQMLLLTQTCQNTHGPRDKGQTLSWKVTGCRVPGISGFIQANNSSQFHILPNGEFWKSNFHHTKARVKREKEALKKVPKQPGSKISTLKKNVLNFKFAGFFNAKFKMFIRYRKVAFPVFQSLLPKASVSYGSFHRCFYA